MRSQLRLFILWFGIFACGIANAAGGIQIQNAWARATPAGAVTGAVYLTIINQGSDDKLISANTDAADMAMLHGMDMSAGVMHMQEMTDGLPVPAGQTVELAPRQSHIMLMGLKHGLKAGGRLHLTLQFQKAGAVPVDVVIRPMSND